MSRSGWEHYELEKEMAKTNLAGLLELFKREDERYLKRCKEFVVMLGNLTPEGKKLVEDECALLNEGRTKVAVRIAEKLTKIDKN